MRFLMELIWALKSTICWDTSARSSLWLMTRRALHTRTMAASMTNPRSSCRLGVDSQSTSLSPPTATTPHTLHTHNSVKTMLIQQI